MPTDCRQARCHKVFWERVKMLGGTLSWWLEG